MPNSPVPSTGKPRAGLRLMHVHAHPDDESSQGAASTAMYVSQGVDVHVATCTGGERGSILNPKMDRPDVLANITEIRRQEMERARDILGVRQDWLGFVDSGWPEGDPRPPLPEGCFALIPLEEATERLENWERDHDWDNRITTRVPCGEYFGVRDPALLAHATQIDPDGFWFAIPREIQQTTWPTEDYELVVSHVDSPTPEDDLFAGITRDAVP